MPMFLKYMVDAFLLVFTDLIFSFSGCKMERIRQFGGLEL